MQLWDKFETPFEASEFFANIEKIQNVFAVSNKACQFQFLLEGIRRFIAVT